LVSTVEKLLSSPALVSGANWRVENRLGERMNPRRHDPEPRIVVADQVGEYLGVGRGCELVASAAFQGLEILADPVVDPGNAAPLFEVRVRVFIRGRPMRRPAGVADAETEGERKLLQQPG
jgi:hypothetical protein